MAPTTFNDGDPIDASTLQSLVTEIATLRSSIPNITTAGTKIELSGKTGVADIVIPQIYGGRSEKITLSAGKWKPFTINYAGKFTSTPKAVVLTPYVTGTSDNRLTYDLSDDLGGQLLPAREVWRGCRKAKFADDEVTQAKLLELQWHLIEGARGGRGNNRLNGNVSEEGDLLAHIVWYGMIGTEDDHVGLNSTPAQLLHRVLRWLRLQFASCGEFWKEGHVDVERVSATNILLQLANRLNEWE